MAKLQDLLLSLDRDDEWIANRNFILQGILLTTLGFVVVYMIVAPFYLVEDRQRIYLASIIEIAVLVGLYILARQGRMRLVSWIFCGALQLLLLAAIVLSGGVDGIGYVSHISLVLVVGLLLGARLAAVSALLNVLLGLTLWYAGASGLLSPSVLEPSPLALWFEILLNIVSVAIFLLVWERNADLIRRRLHHELAERRRAEAVLTGIQEQLQLALSASRIGTWNWQMGESEVVWSSQAGALFGLSPESTPATLADYLELVHPDDREATKARVMRAIKEGEPIDMEHRVIWPDGSIHWLAGKGRVIFDGQGRPARMAGTVLDITERVETQEALRASETNYRTLVENTDDLICRFLPDSTLTYVNDAYCRYFKREREELIGLPFLQLVPPEEHEQIRIYLDELVRGKAGYTYEHQVVTPSGSLRWQQWTDRPIIDADGSIHELQSVGRDINDRRLMEEDLQRSLAEKEALLREIHHRVKNNLQIISSLLKLQAANVTDAQARAIFADSQNRINSMALIHERLYRSGDLAQIDFATYVEALIPHLVRSLGAEARGVNLTLDIPEIQLAVNAAIPCGLIINELVTNALKHAFSAGGQGQITISMEREIDGRYRLTVQDDGSGLPPELNLAESDGLGLQLVQALTAQLQGELVQLSGNGAGFSILFFDV